MIAIIKLGFRKIILKIKQKIREFFCVHRWNEGIINVGGGNHHGVVRCSKCGKSKTLSPGSREEW